MVKQDGKEYPQYRITIPGAFVEKHGNKMFLVADGIGIFVPNEKGLLKALLLLPEIRTMVHSNKKMNPEEIEDVLEHFPEIKKHLTELGKIEAQKKDLEGKNV